MNDDGSTDVLDAFIVQSYLAGRIQLDRIQRLVADTDGNGVVDEGDVVASAGAEAGVFVPQPVDLEPPQVAVTSPTDGETVNPSAVVTGTAQDATGVAWVRVNGMDATDLGGGFDQWRAEVNLPPGTSRVLTVSAGDVLGNSSLNVAMVVVTVRDTTPPIVEITSPQDGQVLDRKDVTVMGSATDDSRIVSVVLNGTQAEDLGVNFSLWRATIVLNEGQGQTIEAIARDEQGNVGRGSVTVDVLLPPQAPPAVAYISPDGILRGDVTVTHRIADVNYDPVDIRVEYSLDGQSYLPATVSGGDGTEELSSAPAGVTHTFVWRTGADIAGESQGVNLRLTPSDDWGDGQPAISPALVIDNLAPRITISSPQDGETLHSNQVTVTGSWRDITGVAYIKVNGVSAETNGQNWQAQIILPAGQGRRIRVGARDNAGNADENAAEVMVNIDVQLPVVQILDPVDGSTVYSNDVTVTGTIQSQNRILQVLVNGQEAVATGGNFSTWQALIHLDWGEDVQILATALDQFGNRSSASVTIDVQQPPPAVPSANITTPGAVVGRMVNVIYTLYSQDSQPASVVVSYSVDGGQSFRRCAEGPGSEGVSGLATSEGGTNHRFVWDSLSDLGAKELTGIILRLIPSDPDGDGEPSFTSPFAVDNAPPRISIDTPENGAVLRSQSIRVQGTLEDLSGGALVAVNGVNATALESGFLSWEANVWLPWGNYRVIEVTAEDKVGNRAVGLAGTAITVMEHTDGYLPVGMVYVPPGWFEMGSNAGRVDERPQHRTFVDGFFIDITEVTNAQYKAFIDATGRHAPAHWQGRNYPCGTGNHPVVGVSYHDALAYAQWVGKRLPTEAEWEKSARGDDLRPYPWGWTQDASKANFGRSVGTTTAVASYRNATSPYGLYDMAGNVGEWVLDWYDADYYQDAPMINPPGSSSGSRRVVRGGSYLSDFNGIRTSNREAYAPSTISMEIGFRCVRSIAPPGMLYVPGEMFNMGSMEGDTDEQPEHTVWVDGFFIDRYPVTNAQYAEFLASENAVNHEGHHPDEPPGKDHTPDNLGALFTDPDKPVVGIDWWDAYAYAAWAGKRLPTEAEWELASKGGVLQNPYPWGMEEPDQTRANYSGYFGSTSPVGLFPLGISYHGVLDLAGNVWEWCWDWYDSDYYSQSPYTNPRGPTTGRLKVLRGGSWSSGAESLRSSNRSSAEPSRRANNIGFRCVRAAPFGRVSLPGGFFTMGTDSGDADERPPHTVNLSPFSIDKFELTNLQYLDFLRSPNAVFHSDHHSSEPAGKDHTAMSLVTSGFDDPLQPVSGVDWWDAYACAVFYGKRLPTEAEWEYAARGSDLSGTLYPWGGSSPLGKANYDTIVLPYYPDNNPRTSYCGYFFLGTSADFVYDLAGNVEEWCWDWYDNLYYRRSPPVNPWGPDTGTVKVTRGGSWQDKAWEIRVSNRQSRSPVFRRLFIGFRLAGE